MTKRGNIAIIPAKGVSKRIKNKNLFDILGKPLLAYTIETCKRWGRFEEIYVNSEDPAIIQCAQDYGSQVYHRPVSLVVDSSKIIDVVKEQISTMGLGERSIVAILPPTCPLRTHEDLEEAYGLFLENDYRSPIVSVTRYEKPPEQALLVDHRGRLVPKYPERYTSNSQDFQDAYRYNTGIIFTTVGVLMKQNDIVGENAIPYIMPFKKSIDIDYPYHVELVKLIMKLDKEGRSQNAII
ncbi:MAG: acylneuraminate cytidylyltransferase family protein [Deltaproteobacteria bacterium]|nr:acylneuraminate cytidylyltransferase family protein [Deltaproteobacteria bacterium]